jgi:hypothetical protein
MSLRVKFGAGVFTAMRAKAAGIKDPMASAQVTAKANVFLIFFSFSSIFQVRR